MCIWSPYCDDPRTMIILDIQTGKIYTQQEAEQAPKEIKSRLVNRCLKQGYWVRTEEESEEILRDKNEK